MLFASALHHLPATVLGGLIVSRSGGHLGACIASNLYAVHCLQLEPGSFAVHINPRHVLMLPILHRTHSGCRLTDLVHTTP